MLQRLSVRDVAVFEAIDVDFASGLNVLTGETGAGKSILLDALGLAIGARGDAALVRRGAARALVSAEFEVPAGHPAHGALAEAGIESAETVVLRRVMQADGRGRAFVNDQPVTIGLLAAIGEAMVEVHGQDDQRGLLRPETHRALLDRFADHAAVLAVVRAGHGRWVAARAALSDASASAAERARTAATLAATQAEIEALAPKPGEDEALAAARGRLANTQRIAEALSSARAARRAGAGVEDRLRGAERALARAAGVAAGALDGSMAALARARIEALEAGALIEAAGRDLAAEPGRIEQVEQRLFALRALARRLGLRPDDLAGEAELIRARLAALAADEAGGARLAAGAAEAEAAFRSAAAALGAAREAAAARLDARVAAELKPLKLGAARFRTSLKPLPFEAWTHDGAERVTFEVATNPGAEFGPLQRIASGGERARFMLAIKAVLARAGDASTLVFDEVDEGVGGAVADAVGARLARLGRDQQVLVVTHSPQVAARGRHHLRVVKEARRESVRVRVEPLDAEARNEEIARMLAGARVTDEARAAADSLLRAGAS